MPTTPNRTYTGKQANPTNSTQAVERVGKLAASLTLLAGQPLQLNPATGLYSAWTTGTPTGPMAVLRYDTTTDAAGLHSSYGGDWGENSLTCQMYAGGDFKFSELSGITAANLGTLLGTHPQWLNLCCVYGNPVTPDANTIVRLG